MTSRPTFEQVQRAATMRGRAYLSVLAEAFVLAPTTEDESKLDDLLYAAGERLGLDAQDFTDLAARKWGLTPKKSGVAW